MSIDSVVVIIILVWMLAAFLKILYDIEKLRYGQKEIGILFEDLLEKLEEILKENDFMDAHKVRLSSIRKRI